MTVVLARVGADGTNTNPMPPIYDDGRFEYVPIPETEMGTAETRTYGSERLQHQDVAFTEYVNWIQPDGKREGRISDPKAIETHPLHYDPDFQQLTYGESSGRGDYVRKLMDLDHGDILAFYAGLSDVTRKHRYLIGYFTVNKVVNTGGLEGDERRAVFEAYRHNAHSKRYLGQGESKFDDIVIIDGKPPGGLFERAPVQLSDYTKHDGNKIPQYYLSDDFARRFPIDDPTWRHEPDSDHKDDKLYLGVKPAIRLDLTAAEFIDRLDDPDFVDEAPLAAGAALWLAVHHTSADITQRAIAEASGVSAMTIRTVARQFRIIAESH